MLKIPLSAHVCLASLFRFLSTVTLRSPHQTKALEETFQFLQANEHRSGNTSATLSSLQPGPCSPVFALSRKRAWVISRYTFSSGDLP